MTPRAKGRSHEATEYRRLYSSARWRRERLEHLSANPLCIFCQGVDLITAATVVDHITPHKGDLVLFWDRANWQSCCKFHHDRTKAEIERYGFHTLTDAKGYPLDPHHPANQ